MKNFSFRVWVFVGAVALMMGCGEDGSGGGGGSGGNGDCPTGQVSCDGVCIDEVAPTLTAIQSDVFAVSCTASSCHDANNPQANLDLSSIAASETNLIDVEADQVAENRVTPGDPGASYLMNKLLGVGMAEGTDRMPQGDPDGLCEPKLEAVRQWILDDAPIE